MESLNTSNLNTSIRIAKDKLFKGVIFLFSFLSILPLLLILFYIINNGISFISWQFITELPKPVGETGGGIANAIIGTIILIVTACVFSVPLGIAAGIYLSENRKGKVSNLVRISVEALQGVPSIVIGIIAYFWIVKPLGHFSALSGGIALGIIMLPVIVKTSEETLILIPDTLKEASLALGVPYHKTLLKVIVPAGFSGIITGIILSISRVAGETAPLLFTAFGNPFMSYNIGEPIHSLPLVIFTYAISPYPEWHALAWGASLILIGLVLALNIISKIVIKKWKVQF